MNYTASLFFKSLLLVLLVTSQACAQKIHDNRIVTGAEQLDVLVPKLKGQRVGMLVNYTAIVGNVHLADTLKSLHVNLVKIYSPEHGFRGSAPDGEAVNDGKDPKTGIDVVSLYGNNRKATPEQIADVDVVIFDIQDVGARFYTYISSLHYMMEACAEQGKKMIILDRPNPNGFIDGPVLKPELRSFVGMHPIPIAHGLTVGELAKMINGEGWLKDQKRCEIEVIPMINYDHEKPYTLPLKPSPNLTSTHAVQLYPYTCLFEGTVLSIGRGTQNAFEIFGHPDLKDQPYQFTPVDIPGMSINPPWKGKVCHGVDLRLEKPERKIYLRHLIDMYNVFPDKQGFFKKYFETLAGTTELRAQIQSGMTEDQIRKTWEPDLAAYKKMREKYTLYK